MQKEIGLFLYYLVRQKHYWSYIAFNQMQLVEGKKFPVVPLPHEAK